MALSQDLDNNPASGWEALQEKLVTEIQQVQRELNEIDLLLDQSKGEVDKLTRRNATISAHLQQVQSQLEELPPSDIRVAYDAALETQQRLVVMRGRLEKLQSDKEHIESQLEILKQIKEVADSRPPDPAEGEPSATSLEALIQAQESERQRLSRQMHDGPAQALSNFILQTEIALRLFDVDPEKARQELSELKSAASSTFQKVRDFIFDLRPMMLDDLGLVPTLKRYADTFAEKSGLEIVVTVTGSERRLEPYLEVVIFRALQELMTNASLHAQASQINVQLEIGDNRVRASIEDDGRGLEPHALPQEAELGVKAIRERMDMLGGSFEVDSTAGQGSRFSLSIPIEASPLLSA